MKLWWAHNETMIAYLMAYKATKDPNHILKFKTVIDYCYDHVSNAKRCIRQNKRISLAASSLSTTITESGSDTFTGTAPSPWT